MLSIPGSSRKVDVPHKVKAPLRLLPVTIDPDDSNRYLHGRKRRTWRMLIVITGNEVLLFENASYFCTP